MSNWKKVVATLAPTLATALGGPLAGTAAKFLAAELLGDENAVDDLENAILNSSPQQLATLREIDNKFSTEMKRLDIDIFALEVEDKKSARDMAKADMRPQVTLSVMFIGGYFWILYLLFSGDIIINESIRDISNILIGALTVNIPNIMQFWFGSSHGSKQKTK